MTLHNLLFLIGYPAEKSVFLSSFVQGQGQQREQKHETKKLVEFHNQPTLTMVYVTAFLKIDLFYKYKEGLRFCKRWPCSMYVCMYCRPLLLLLPGNLERPLPYMGKNR